MKSVMVNLGQPKDRINSDWFKGKAIESLHAELGKESQLHCLLLQIGLLAGLLLLRKDR